MRVASQLTTTTRVEVSSVLSCAAEDISKAWAMMGVLIKDLLL